VSVFLVTSHYYEGFALVERVDARVDVRVSSLRVSISSHKSRARRPRS
jgi:hypothetical protein